MQKLIKIIILILLFVSISDVEAGKRDRPILQYSNYYDKNDTVSVKYEEFKQTPIQGRLISYQDNPGMPQECVGEQFTGKLYVSLRVGEDIYKFGKKELGTASGEYTYDILCSLKVKVLYETSSNNEFIEDQNGNDYFELHIEGTNKENIIPEDYLIFEISDMDHQDGKKIVGYEIIFDNDQDNSHNLTPVMKQEVYVKSFISIERKYAPIFVFNPLIPLLKPLEKAVDENSGIRLYTPLNTGINELELKPIRLAWEENDPLSCEIDFHSYQVQLLKLENTLGNSDGNNYSNYNDTKTIIDWSKALNIEVKGGEKFVDLYISEGSGVYTWRVRPISNIYEGGIANSENWGLWNEYSMLDGETFDKNNGSVVISNGPIFYFDFKLDDDIEDLNWIHTQTFVEGESNGSNFYDQIVYADNLLKTRQTQKKLNNEDYVVSGQTVPDLVGRSSLSSLNAPVTSLNALDKSMYNQDNIPKHVVDLTYKNDVFNATGSNVYSASNFDMGISNSGTDLNYTGPMLIDNINQSATNYGQIHNYYGGLTSTEETGVPSAEGYGYSRVINYNDGSERVREQRMPGVLSHNTQTNYGKIKKYYSVPTSWEVSSIFPHLNIKNDKIYKEILIDQNGTYNVTYKDNAGRILATAIKKSSSSIMQDLSEPDNMISTSSAEFNILNGSAKENSLFKYKEERDITVDDNYSVSYQINPEPIIVNDNCIVNTVNVNFETENISLQIPFEVNIKAIDKSDYYSNNDLLNWSKFEFSYPYSSINPVSNLAVGGNPQMINIKREIKFNEDATNQEINLYALDLEEDLRLILNETFDMMNFILETSSDEAIIQDLTTSLVSLGWISPNHNSNDYYEQNFFRMNIPCSSGTNCGVTFYLPSKYCEELTVCSISSNNSDWEMQLFEMYEDLEVYDDNGNLLLLGDNIENYFYRKGENLFPDKSTNPFNTTNNTHNGAINTLITNMLAEKYNKLENIQTQYKQDSDYPEDFNEFVDNGSNVWEPEEVCNCWQNAIVKFGNIVDENDEILKYQGGLYLDDNDNKIKINKDFDLLAEYLNCTGTMFKSFSNKAFDQVGNSNFTNTFSFEDDFSGSTPKLHISFALDYLNAYFKFGDGGYIENAHKYAWSKLSKDNINQFFQIDEEMITENHNYSDKYKGVYTFKSFYLNKNGDDGIYHHKDLIKFKDYYYNDDFAGTNNDGEINTAGKIYSPTDQKLIESMYQLWIGFKPLFDVDKSKLKEGDENYADSKSKEADDKKDKFLLDEDDPENPYLDEYNEYKDLIDGGKDGLEMLMQICLDACNDRGFEEELRRVIREHPSRFVIEDDPYWMDENGVEYFLTWDQATSQISGIEKLNSDGTRSQEALVNYSFLNSPSILYTTEEIDELRETLISNCKSDCSIYTENVEENGEIKTRIYNSEGDYDQEALDKLIRASSFNYELQIPFEVCDGSPFCEYSGRSGEEYETLIPSYIQQGTVKSYFQSKDEYIIGLLNNFSKTYQLIQDELIEEIPNNPIFAPEYRYHYWGTYNSTVETNQIGNIGSPYNLNRRLKNCELFEFALNEFDPNLSTYWQWNCEESPLDNFDNQYWKIPDLNYCDCEDGNSILPHNIPDLQKGGVSRADWIFTPKNQILWINSKNPCACQNEIVEYKIYDKLKYSLDNSIYKIQLQRVIGQLDDKEICNHKFPKHFKSKPDHFSTKEQLDKNSIIDLGENYKYSQITGTILEIPESAIALTQNNDLAVCFRWVEPYGDEGPSDEEVLVVESCGRNAVKTMVNLLNHQVEEYTNKQKRNFTNKIHQAIVNQVENGFNSDENLKEKLTLNLGNQEFKHITLYNYDRAGNLTGTVPPKGFITSGLETELKMQTKYKYNSLGQVIESTTPEQSSSIVFPLVENRLNTPIVSMDGQTLNFYDNAGRIRISINPKQMNNLVDYHFVDPIEQITVNQPKATYFKYDNLGRLIESGEYLIHYENINQQLMNEVDNAEYLKQKEYFTLGDLIFLYSEMNSLFSNIKLFYQDNFLTLLTPQHQLLPEYSQRNFTSSNDFNIKLPSNLNHYSPIQIDELKLKINEIKAMSEGIMTYFIYKEKFEEYLTKNINFPEYNLNSIPAYYDNELLTSLNHRIRRIGQQTITTYDISANELSVIDQSLKQRYLRGRISNVKRVWDKHNSVVNNKTDNVVSYYSYDQHGNVEWYLQYINMSDPNSIEYSLPSLFAKTEYEYDLLTGNVTEVKYNNGLVDEFNQLYRYDADSRLMDVQSTRHGRIYDNDSRYHYYKYGPLRRREIGEDMIQGLDYTYTINGWLKSVNSTVVGKDPGEDGTMGLYPKDIFAMQLDYYTNDYATNSTNNPVNNSSVPSIDLYNGNISRWDINYDYPTRPTLTTLNNLSMDYLYDDANRLLSQTNPINALKYNTSYVYDANGNILNIMRNDESGSPTTHVIDLKDSEGADISNQIHEVDGKQYSYDEIGNMIDDGEIEVEWTPDGKIDNVTVLKTLYDDFNQEVPVWVNIKYRYDALGNRVAKVAMDDVIYNICETATGWNVNHDFNTPCECIEYLGAENIIYAREANGKTIARYKYIDHVEPACGFDTPWVEEWYTYGSSADGRIASVRPFLGELKDATGSFVGELIHTGPNNIGSYYTDLMKSENAYGENTGYFAKLYKGARHLDVRNYEIKDHLGNVRAVVSDVKEPVDGQSYTDPINTWQFEPTVVNISNYYPFGLELPSGTFSRDDDYNFGFNGMERNDNLNGNGVAYDFGARMYNANYGRFFSRDPLEKEYPYFSTYVGIGNNPILFIDPDGRSIRVVRPEIKNQVLAALRKYTNDEIDIDKDGYIYLVNKDNKNLDRDLSVGTKIIRDMLGRDYEDHSVSIEKTGHSEFAWNTSNGTIIMQVKIEGQWVADPEAFQKVDEATGKVTNGKGTGSLVGWNPNSEKGGYNVNGSQIRPPSLGLMHELIHAWLIYHGAVDPEEDSGYHDPDQKKMGKPDQTLDQDEVNARKIENKIRNEQKMPKRIDPETYPNKKK